VEVPFGCEGKGDLLLPSDPQADAPASRRRLLEVAAEGRGGMDGRDDDGAVAVVAHIARNVSERLGEPRRAGTEGQEVRGDPGKEGEIVRFVHHMPDDRAHDLAGCDDRSLEVLDPTSPCPDAEPFGLDGRLRA